MANELADFLARPTAGQLLRLRAMVLSSPSFDALSDEDEQLAGLLDAGACDEAADLAERMMPGWLLSPQVHRLAAQAAERLGDAEGAAQARYLARACLHAMLQAGDGSAERPYPVLHATDEYALLDALGRRATGQHVARTAQGLRDVIACDDGTQVWFDMPIGPPAA